jgi:2'-5' RNA ligase
VPVIGVALSIPEPWASELQDYRTGLDPAAARVPTHITLIPPTDIDDDTLAVVENHLDKVAEAGAAFAVHLRGTGTFRPVSPVVFISLAEGISQTEQLAAAVRSGPLDVDVEFPFHPHVTVAHRGPVGPGLCRPGGLRVLVRGVELPPLRPRRRRRMAADA